MRLSPLVALALLTACAAGPPLADYLGPDGWPSRPGYFAGRTPASATVIPPPPAPGSAAEAADFAVFDATRKLEGRPRWSLAAADAEQKPRALLADFDCAVGAALNDRDLPRTSRLLARVMQDGRAVNDSIKTRYERPRPYQVRPAPVCSHADENRFSYPSGHTTASWSYALILAELFPDRAVEILGRGRSYGESRVVCGNHYVSDIEAARTSAAMLVAALHGDPAFRRDLEAARKEAQALVREPLPAGRCRVQDEAARIRPW